MKVKPLILTLALSAAYFQADAQNVLNSTDTEQRYLTELYRCLNPADKADRTDTFYLENAIRPALLAREELPWGKTVPEREWIHFVLPLRVNNEAIDTHRPLFYKELRERIGNLSMKEAILEINHWCHEKVTYQPSDGRTHSPLQTINSAVGRCGEESTFTVAALRSMGIPARQVYTPRWAHTDDNHAWVEAWADGNWYFLGACEPEPVLNLGWFNAPAARGMLMHARVPGSHYDGPEEVLTRMNGNTDINVTANYAPVDTLTVSVLNIAGFPVPDAEVSFRIYNYAEFYPIATKTADKKGKASIISGLGDILVWATSPDGSNFGFIKSSVGKEKTVTLTLDKNSSSTCNIDLDIIPPVKRDAIVDVTAAMRVENDRRMAYEDSIRQAYTSTFATENQVDGLAETLGISDSDRLWKIMQKSRGNHKTISAFLLGIVPSLHDKAMSLLCSISDKDLTDISLNILCDHIRADEYGGKLFAEYVMSPRIASEELTSFRSFFRNVISPERSAGYRICPMEWVRWVADSIDCSLDWYPAQATMSPRAVWENRQTSPLSRDIFFVAGARTFGIPSRIDPVTMKTQWADSSGEWHDAVFSKTTSMNQKPSLKANLSLPLSASTKIDDPKYYSHFTVSKIVNGDPRLLNYPDFIPLSQSFANGQDLDCGQYMIVTGQRMANGSVLSHIDIVNLDTSGIIDSLIVRNDPTGIQVIGSFDSESKFMPENESSPRSLLSATGRGYYVLGILRPNHEPSNHALRDLSAEKHALEKWGRPIVLLYENSDAVARNESVDIPEPPSTVISGTDIDSSILELLKSIQGISGDETPIFIIADTFNRVVFMSQGYTIGLGRQISDITKRLD